MDKNKGGKEQDKKQARFANQGQQEQVQAEKQQIENRPKQTYKNIQECRDIAQNTFSKVDTEFKNLTETDPKIVRKDTAKSLQYLLDLILELLQQLNLGNFNDKSKNYYLTYNATIYLLDICEYLRKSVYTALTIDYLAYAIVSLEGNNILQTVKYLEWRIKLYIVLAHCYEEIGSVSSALKTIERCQLKVQESKEIEMLDCKDKPLPDFMEKIFNNNVRILNATDIKFKLHNGTLTVDAWKKKVEETFAVDKEGKILAVIESLRVNNKKLSNTIEKQGKKLPWKENAVIAAYDIFKNDIQTLVNALKYLAGDRQITSSQSQRKEEIINTAVKQPQQQQNQQQQQQQSQQQQPQEELKEVPAEIWKAISKNFPLEYHVELCQFAYEIGHTGMFEELTRTAHLRCKHRRIEVPYIKNVKFVVGNNDSKPGTPDNYDKVPIDINEASLRMELRKLRNKTQGKKKEEKKEEVTTKKDEKKDDKKQGKQTKEAQQEQKKSTGIDATQDELDQINHQYIYLVVEKSQEPDQAIHSIDVQMDQEKIGPKSTDKVHLEIPVKQYTGVQETNKSTPWLSIKKSNTGLQDEEEKKTLVIDILPLFGKNPEIRPDLGYQKIQTDIRQTPPEFIKSPNMEYVYITYKTDRYFFTNERELNILSRLWELEKTTGKDKIQSLEEEKRVQLDLVFDFNKLLKLIETIKDSLYGPLGEQFFDDRGDFLVNLCFYIWKKYFKNQIYQINFVYELKSSLEITESEFLNYRDIFQQIKLIFTEGLKTFNLVMRRNKKLDIIWFCKYNLELCKFLEEQQEYKLAIQNIRFCLQKISQHRDYMLERGVESQKDYFLPFCITANNQKIRDMIEKMKESYILKKNNLNLQIRIQQRKKKAQDLGLQNEHQLEKDEEEEEENEYLEAQAFFLNDDNRDNNYFNSLETHNSYTENELILISLHADFLINLFRCELKAGRQIGDANQNRMKFLQSMKEEKSEIYMVHSQAQRIMQIPYEQQEHYAGIADKDKIKTTLMEGETAKTIKKNFVQLNDTLQKSGNREPPKAQSQNYEKFLIDEVNANPYQKALLYMMLAQNKNKQSDQQYLLGEALKFINEAEEMEKMHIQTGIEDAIFVFSTLLENKETKQTSSNFFPFNHLYKQRFIPKSKMPRKPVLIGRNSQSITFKLPPFQPEIPEMVANTDPNKERILQMAIFGKISAHGVDVQETCKDLHNTGTRQKLGQVVTIKNLLQNEQYCFAVGAYDANEELSRQIGKTSENILCLQPLPINLLSSYLAKIAYQIGDFDKAEIAADHTFSYFTEKSEFVDRNLNFEENPCYIYRLKQNILLSVSLIEIQSLQETLIVKARCLKRRFFVDGENSPHTTKMQPNILILEHQKNVLKVCNYLIMAAETSLCTNNWIACKRIAAELYNTITDLLTMDRKTVFIFHILLKAQMLISSLPKQYWDKNMRIISAKICYEINKLSFQLAEINVSKRVLYSEVKLFNSKWYTFSRIEMIAEDQQEKKDDKKQSKKDAKKDAKKGKKDDNNTNQQEQEEQVKMIPHLIRDLYETPSTVQTFLEQTLLSFSDEYSEYVQRFVDSWKEAIEYFLPYVENSQAEKDKMINDLNVYLDFWDNFKDLNTAYSKIQTSYKGHPLYLEICCRLFKRQLESGTDVKYIYECINKMDEIPVSEIVKMQDEIYKLKMQAIHNDIDWHPNMIGELIKYNQTNKQGYEQAIEIFKIYFDKQKILDQLLAKEETSVPIHTRNLYQNLFLAEKNILHVVTAYMASGITPQPREVAPILYYDITQLRLENFQEEEEYKLKRPLHIDKNQIALFQNVFKQIAVSTYQSVNAQAWIQLQNSFKLVYNILVYEMLNPLQHKGTDIWQHLVMICESAMAMLDSVRKNGLYPLKAKRNNEILVNPQSREGLRSQNQNRTGSQQQQRVTFENKADKIDELNGQQYPSEMPLLSNTLSKEFWFNQEKQLNVDLIANLVSYTLQTLLLEEKWNTLISVSRKFSNLTEHFYSQYVLPYTNHAQTILYEIAKKKTLERLTQFQTRTAEYEDWKANNKKRKTRTAQLTGEVQKEEIDYENDKKDFERQIKVLQQNEDFIKNEKELCVNLKDQIQSSLNSALKDLYSHRRQLISYGNEEKLNYKEGEQLISMNDAAQLKKGQAKVSKQKGIIIVGLYKNIQDTLIAKKEKFAAVQAKKEQGNLIYANGNKIEQVEQIWVDSLDGIFNRPSTLRTYKKVLNEYGPTVAHTIGIKQMLVGVNILYNLSYYCYFNELGSQRDAIQMASEICFSIFRVAMPHSQIYLGYSKYRLREISLKEDVFKDYFTLDPAETLLSCYRISWQLLDSELALKALPMLALMDYIATDIVLSVYFSMRAKIMRSIALSQCGCINESLQILQRAYQEKDLPINWQKQSEWFKREKGCNWAYNELVYNNSGFQMDENNKQISESLLSKMELPKNFAILYGQSNYNMFIYARAMLVFSINQNEIHESHEMYEQRRLFMQRSETILRDLLKKIAFEEELEFLTNKIRLHTSVQDELSTSKTIIQNTKEEVLQHFLKRDIKEKVDQENYFINREENFDYISKREERLQMIGRVRFLLVKINNSLTFFHKSYWILKYAILNLLRYAKEKRNCETGEDPEIEGIDSLKTASEEFIGGKGGGGKAGQAAQKTAQKEVKKEEKDQKKGGKQGQQNLDDQKLEEKKKLEEKRKEEMEAECENSLKLIEEKRVRRHLSMFWILKLKTELVSVLYFQNKFDDVAKFAEKIKQDCNTKDKYFNRTLQEYLARVSIKQGKPFKEAKKQFEEVITHSKTQNIIDESYIKILGDFAEVLQERGEVNEALHYFEQAMNACDQLLLEQSYFPFPQNNNKKAIDEKIKAFSELQLTSEQEEEILQKQDRGLGGPQKGGKKDDKKGKDDPKNKNKDKKQQQQQQKDEVLTEMKLEPLNKLVEVNFMNKINHPPTDIDAQSNNSTKIGYNIYTKNVLIYIRSVLRYLNCLLDNMREDAPLDDNIKNLLIKVDIVKEIMKTFIIPISLKIEIEILFGKFYRKKFEFHVREIQNQYINKFNQTKNPNQPDDENWEKNRKKYKSLAQKKPHRDLCRNKYLIEVPNFSNQLRENLLPLLDESIKRFESGCGLFLSASVFIENGRKFEDVCLQIAETYLLKREYTQRVGYKYIQIDEYQNKIDLMKENGEIQQRPDIKNSIEEDEKKQKGDKTNNETHAYNKILMAILITQKKNNLIENFADVLAPPQQNPQNTSSVNSDATKMPIDLFYDIVEQDFIYKMEQKSMKVTLSNNVQEEIVLFDEQNKKKTVTSMDLLMLLLKYYNEAKVMTFSNWHLQNKITKLHRFLKNTPFSYAQKCTISTNEQQVATLSDGKFIIKNYFVRENDDEYKFIYLLGGLDKAKIQLSEENKEDIKIILNAEKEQLYGNIYIQAENLDGMLQSALNLKSKMEESNKKSEKAKQRDYKYHKKAFKSLIEEFGSYFFLTDKKQKPKNKSQIDTKNLSTDDEEVSILKQYASFIPQLTLETIDILIKIFNQNGYDGENNNFLAIFRFFHHSKYL